VQNKRTAQKEIATESGGKKMALPKSEKKKRRWRKAPSTEALGRAYLYR
jgi:hypothetical protein